MFRLKLKKDFGNVFAGGSSCKQDFLVLKYLKNSQDSARFGFVISNKVSKKAVFRNKIRRKLKSIIKSNLENIKKGFDYIIIVSPREDYKDIEKQLINVFKKAKAIK